MNAYGSLRRSAGSDGGWQRSGPGRTSGRSHRPAPSAFRHGATGISPAAAAVESRGTGVGGEVTVEFDIDDGGLAAIDELAVGMKVLHGKYGRGTIISSEGSGERLKLTVSFPGFGRKKLMARYAGLRVL